MHFLTKHSTHNNSVLKIVTAALFIIFPLIAFALGMQLQALISTDEQITQTKIIKTEQEDTEKSLIRRCGQYPDGEYFHKKDHFDVIAGPLWSPDCRNIAWSLWQSGSAWLGDDSEAKESSSKTERKLSGREGVFIYNEILNRAIKIYSPTQLDEAPQVVRWEDRKTLVFKANNKEYRYDLKSSSIIK